MDQSDDSLNIMTSTLQRRVAMEGGGDTSTTADDVDANDDAIMNAHSSPVIAVAADLPSFQYFISEQAKSMLALQELQNEVGALLEFRDLVMEAFPHLSQKLQTTYGNVTQSQTALSPTRWEPGIIRVKRKPGQQLRGGDSDMLVSSLLPRYRSNSQGKASRSSEVSGGSAISSAIQDSGFCTESNKDHSSAISSRSKSRETEDELFSLLDHIHSKGTRLKLEVEYLWGKVDPKSGSSVAGTNKRKCKSLDDLIQTTNGAAQSFTFECAMRTAFLEAELSGLKKERDLLLKKIADIESENRANLAQTNQLLHEVETMSAEKKDLEERLQEAEVGRRSPTNNLHTNFLGRGGHWRNAQSPLVRNQLLNLMQVFKESSNQGGGGGGASGEDGSSTAAHFLNSKNAMTTATISPAPVSKDSYYTPEHSQSPRIDRPANPVTKELNVYSSHLENACRDSSLNTLASTKDFNEQIATIGDRVNHGTTTNGRSHNILDGFQSGRLPFVEPNKEGGGITLSKEKVLSILNEYDPVTLHRFLLTLCYQMEALNVHVQRLTESRVSIFQRLEECKKENDKLKLELKVKDIELEGTRAENRELERMRNEKLCYSTSDLATTTMTMAAASSCRSRISPLLSDTVLLAEKSAMDAALSNHISNRDTCDRMRNGGSSMRPNVSRIPLKTPPTKVNSSSGKTKTLTSFKEYPAFQSSCISYTSSSLSNK